MSNSWFQRYILPGFIFQSAVIGGAYGSGKELAEFFLGHGAIGGLLGMLVTMLVFSVVLMAAYEFSRLFQLFDYRSFCRHLLGRGWPVYEALYAMQMILVISVVGAAAGDIFRDTFSLPAFAGTAGVMVAIALLVFYGTPAIERFLGFWSVVLYVTYFSFFAWHLMQNGTAIADNLANGEMNGNWLRSGVAFSGYNMSVIPAILFCVRHHEKRSDAIIAGALAGPLAMVPALLFFTAMIGQYDVLLDAGANAALPITVLIGALSGAAIFVYLFPVVLFGTFVETGAAMIHGVNERLDHTMEEKGLTMPGWVRPLVAIAILFTAVILADALGLTTLVAKRLRNDNLGLSAGFRFAVAYVGRVANAPQRRQEKHMIS